ncbi:MAG: hypothetical protein K2N58_07545 [Treponemataceae bacterium]|nr:hypothetical protein [Treponemataceae bacterium]
MKNIIAALVGLLLCASAFAEAPELKNIMPNSWKKLTRLSEAEERAFVSQGEGKKSMDEFKKENYRKNFFDFRVYRETVCGVDFYRLLIYGGELETFFAQTYGDKVLGDYKSTEYDKFCNEMRRASTAQIVFARGKDDAWKEIWNMEIREHLTIEPIGTPFTDALIFNDLIIRRLNEREIGFFTTEASIEIKVGNGEPVYFPNSEGNPWGSTGGAFGAYYNKIKGQLAGDCEMYFTKRNVDEEISSARSKDEIKVDASTYLFDPKCPLRYSIQNAFDGDPATSYVENTEDDLILVEIGVSGNISRLAIINGYASNEYYYKVNNRVRGLSGDIDFADNNMRYQIIKCLGNYLQFDSIYKGELYNDTCLAELNLFVDNKWLFGDIDE